MGRVAEGLLPEMYEGLTNAVQPKKSILSTLSDSALDMVDKINDGAPAGTIADMYSPVKKSVNPSWLSQLFQYLANANDDGTPGIPSI